MLERCQCITFATAVHGGQLGVGPVAAMQPLGQFNLGFIIARLQQDLFIVDQHAAGGATLYVRACKRTQISVLHFHPHAAAASQT